MKKIIHLMTVVITLVMLCGISEAGEKITICGSGDNQELLRALGEAFEKSHPGTIIEVPESIGSSGGIRSIADDKCDMGRVARPIREKEKKYNLSYRLFALSPIVFVTNASVTGVGSLTPAQIKDIYSGKTANWAEVGGPDAKIYVANREPGDSSRTILEELLPGFREIHEPAGKTLYSTPETVETIINHEGTIGYTALTSAANTNMKIMKLDGVDANEKNVREHRYNLVSPYGIVWKGELQGLALSFLNYIFSPDAAKIFAEYGAVPAE